jgi:hypothetical protein
MILVLVDVDNLLGQQPSSTKAAQVNPPTIRQPSRLASQVQVCLGMNLKSASVFATWKEVEALATRVAYKIAPRSGSIQQPTEVALCLPMPEAVDRALLRLLSHHSAPSEPPLEEIWLLSHDHGLQQSMTTLLQSLGVTQRGQQGVVHWKLTRHVGRTPPQAPIPHGRGTTLPKVTALLDSSSYCAAAAGLSPQCPTDWIPLLSTVDRNPWVLSQVGVTFEVDHTKVQGSVRGVARLRATLLGQATTLACAPEDGVEVGHGSGLAAWNFQVQNPTVTRATVGPGAVRLSWLHNGVHLGLTLRTRLPSWLVASNASNLQTSLSAGPVLDDEAVLGTCTKALHAPLAKVRFSSHQNLLLSKVTSTTECWWWHPSSNPWCLPVPSGTARVHGAGPLLGAMLKDIDAEQAVAPGALLYLRSPLAFGTMVQVIHPIPRGQIGLGEVPGTGLRCAVLASRALAAKPVPCMAIQAVSTRRLQHLLEHQMPPLMASGLVPLLQELPLVIPLRCDQEGQSKPSLSDPS